MPANLVRKAFVVKEPGERKHLLRGDELAKFLAGNGRAKTKWNDGALPKLET